MPRPRHVLPAIVTLGLLLTSCAAGTTDAVADAPAALPAGPTAPASAAADDAAPAATADTSDAVAAEPAAEVPAAAEQEERSVEALWWTADTVDGGQLVADDLAGGNVVLWMWAPWCSVCNREAPDVAAALADLPDDVTIVGVAGKDELGPMQAFVAEHGLEDMQHVVDADGSLWASYGISYQPAWVFIDAQGEASVAAGAIGYDGLFEGIRQVFGDA